jgi:hypothetical protein
MTEIKFHPSSPESPNGPGMVRTQQQQTRGESGIVPKPNLVKSKLQVSAERILCRMLVRVLHWAVLRGQAKQRRSGHAVG